MGRYVTKPRIDFSNLKTDIVSAAILFLPSVATAIYTQCDKVMIEMLTGATEQVSYYDYAEKIVTIPMTFIIVLSTVMMPRISNEFKKGNVETISDLINRAARFSMFLAIPMTLGLITVADKLVPWYLGEAFAPVVYAIMLISPIVITNTLTGISGGQYFTATNQVGVLIGSQFTAAIANVVINAILIPLYGFYGAAIATLMTSICCALFQYACLLKQIRFPGLCKAVIKCVLAAVLMSISIRLITRGMLPNPATNALQLAIGVTVYGVICSILRVDEMAYIGSMIKSKLGKQKE